MTTCRRFYREGEFFSLCVNIGEKDYVLAEHPDNTNTIFYYTIKGSGKLGKMFSEESFTIKAGDFTDVRDTLHDYRTFHSMEDFHLVGFNTLDKNQNWEGRLIESHESKLDLKLVRDLWRPTFLLCLNGKPIVNGKIMKRYEFAQLDITRDYSVELGEGVLGLFYMN